MSVSPSAARSEESERTRWPVTLIGYVVVLVAAFIWLDDRRRTAIIGGLLLAAATVRLLGSMRRPLAAPTFASEAAKRAAIEQAWMDLLALSPADFEGAVAKILRAYGFKGIRRVGRAGDLGIDIVARDAENRSVVVQCKRYASSKRVGSPDIQHFIGMSKVHHKADLAIFATTAASFTKPATDLAHRHGIRLLAGPQLALDYHSVASQFAMQASVMPVKGRNWIGPNRTAGNDKVVKPFVYEAGNAYEPPYGGCGVLRATLLSLSVTASHESEAYEANVTQQEELERGDLVLVAMLALGL